MAFVFFLWSVPAIYGAFTVCKEKNSRYSKVDRSSFFLISFSVAIVTITSIFSETREAGLGGTTNQSSSYISVLAYGLSLYFFIFGKNHHRFTFTKSKIYKVIFIVWILTNLIGTILYGGRGAFVLLVIYTVVIFADILKNISFKNITVIVFLIIIIRLFLPLAMGNQLII